MLGTLVYDRPVRDRVIDGQRRRLQDFTPLRVQEQLAQVLAAVM